MSLRMSGVHKSAVLLLSLGAQAAQDILRRLPSDIADQVAGEFAALRNLPPAVRVDVLAEFCDAATQMRLMAGPSNGANGLPPPATPFAALHDANPDNLVDCLRDEHPQAIALILAHLPAARCAEVLSALSSQQQFEVVKRLAHIEQASAEVIREVEHSLEGRVRSIVSRVARGEAEQNRGAMADVLDRASRGSLDTPQLSRSLPSPPQGCGPLQVVFEDLLLVDDDGVRNVLEQISAETIALALRTAGADLRQKVLHNVSAHVSWAIQEEQRMLHGASLAQVEDARREVEDALRRLAVVGDVEIARRRDESVVV